MFDDLLCLRENPLLLNLLTHYARLGADNREVWQLRLSELESATSADLTQLHGELLAFDWIELNVGHTPCSYRITSAGLRAMQEMQAAEPATYPATQAVGDQAA